MKNLNEKRPSGLALLPFAMFIVIYMGAGIYYQVTVSYTHLTLPTKA